ncbi:hypothetical protein [Streptomyces sp. BBFR102]|uniref:hypothetical protein n=1 Tax=Streptomyces sp. BBFR102 TaxID=3448171 RepID=UPI003F531DC2
MAGRWDAVETAIATAGGEVSARGVAGASTARFERLGGELDAVVHPRLGALGTRRPGPVHEHAAVHDLTGRPASAPFGRDADGVPPGMRFAAPAGGEGLLSALASQRERAAPWNQEVPTLQQD